jgi:8-oxo-dGTP pyrophosphatase MutT (NUDIX family)
MRKVARAFVKNKQWKYLLTKHRWKNIWVLPGWWMEWNESIFKCIKRELKEEFNLEIKLIWDSFEFKTNRILKTYPNPICSYKIEFDSKKYWTQKRLEYIFLAEIKNDISDIIVQEEEIWEYKFFTLDEIINLENTFEQIKEIAEYLKNNEK